MPRSPHVLSLLGLVMFGGCTTPTVSVPSDGVATHLVVTAQPTSGVAGVTLAPAFVVHAVDASGADAPSPAITITATLTAAPGMVGNSAGATLGGTTSAPTTSGIATFRDLSVSAVGTAVLSFSAPGLGSVVASPVLVAAATGSTPYLAPNIAAHNFNDSTPGPFVNTFLQGITFPTDPTGSGRGRIMRVHYIGSGPQADINKMLELSPPKSLGWGSTFYFGGDVYFPTGTVNFTNGGAARKLLYYRTTSSMSLFIFFQLWGDGIKISWSESGNNVVTPPDLFRFQMGRWYRVETQVTMNRAAASHDGIIRLWVDGALVYENTAVNFTPPTQATAPFWEVWWIGQQREGTDVGGTQPEPSVDEFRYWDNVAFSTTRVGP